MSVASFPDRGKDLRESIGKRLNVVIGRGRKVHPAFVSAGIYHSKALGDVLGVTVETFCGLCIEFKPYDESALEDFKAHTESSAYRESEEGERCDRCMVSMTAMLLGRSRKRVFTAKPKAAKRTRKRAETFQQVRKRRQDETLKDRFAQAVFGVSGAEMKRRGIVTTGRGRGTKYALGDDDGSDNPGA